MLSINHDKIEKFYDFLDKATLFIYQEAKLNYLDSFLMSVDYMLAQDEKLNRLDEKVMDGLNRLYEKKEEETYNKEEIRKAFQLSLLKAFKHLKLNMNDITPDSIGMLFSYFVDLFFQKQDRISVLDANVGCGNLLFSMTNNSNKVFSKMVGVDINPIYLDISLRLANLLENEVEFFNQNNLEKMLIPPVDLIISDLPVDDEKDIKSYSLLNTKNKITYKPYLMIENLMKYGKEGCYYFYLIPNDFFTKPKNDVMKDIILKESHIQAIIELPVDMFKEKRNQKSILILRKRGQGLSVNKEILMLRFPSFKEKDKVKRAIDKVHQWYHQNI